MLHDFNYLIIDEKKYFVKEKMEKKKALRKAAVLKPKGNGINEGLVQWELCLCRSLLAAFI